MGRLERNAAAVRTYIVEVWPRLEKPGGVPDIPFGRKHKGTTRPPTTDRALRLMDANRHASKILAPLIAESRRHDISWGGIRVNALLFAIEYDPATARNWKATKAPEGDVLWKFCLLLARAAQVKWDDCEITEPDGAVVKEAGTPLDMNALDLVVTHLEGEPDDTELEASEWQTAHNRDNNHKKKMGAEESYKRVYAKFLPFKERMKEEEPTATPWGVKGMFCQEYEEETGWSLDIRTLGRAIKFCEGRTTEERPMEGVWRDFGGDDEDAA